jgi:23S rRNA (pseudouridine1915-N3)-methyltransferase
MHIRIIALGQKMPGWVDAGCDDYLKRLPPELSVELVTLPVATQKSRDSVEHRKLRQCSAIMEKLGPGGINIALDEQGEQWPSQKWSRQMQRWMFEQPRVNLIIGGPDGLSQQCLELCQHQVSLGRMTMPHALLRVVLLEQLYRAWTIIKGHPYHRE